MKHRLLFAFSLLLLSAVLPASAQLLVGYEFVGKWMRSDGTYELLVESVHHDGSAVAKYFNPKPINVESAAIMQEGELTILTIVLRDEGYPGSTYQLMHHPDEKQLVGYYMMPDQDQRFEVSFVPAVDKEPAAPAAE